MNSTRSMFDLDPYRSEPYAEHNGNFDMLHAIIMYINHNQRGHGVVAVSPRYAEQAKKKLDVFWKLPPEKVGSFRKKTWRSLAILLIPPDSHSCAFTLVRLHT